MEEGGPFNLLRFRGRGLRGLGFLILVFGGFEGLGGQARLCGSRVSEFAVWFSEIRTQHCGGSQATRVFVFSQLRMVPLQKYQISTFMDGQPRAASFSTRLQACGTKQPCFKRVHSNIGFAFSWLS